MSQYISKSALVAEIQKKRNEYINSLMTEQVHTLSDMLDFIDTLEVKDMKFFVDAFINKACEWLKSGGYFVNNSETEEDFRKAMEE